jgi:GntR family transcriptional regulator
MKEKRKRAVGRKKLSTAFTSPKDWTPLYHKLFRILRDKIMSGEYPEGTFLPGEHDLADAYQVSRITARHALNDIAEAGLAVREVGRGTRVLHVSDGLIMRGPIDAGAVLDGQKRRREILEFGNIAAPDDVAHALALKKDTIIQRMARRFVDQEGPYALIETFVVLEIAASWTEKDFAQTSLNAMIQRAGFVVNRVDECVTAVSADKNLANKIKIKVGAPLLKITRTMFDPQDTPIEFVIAYYVSERYRYQSTLRREGNRLKIQT